MPSTLEQDLVLLEQELHTASAPQLPADAAARATWLRYQRIFEDAGALAAHLHAPELLLKALRAGRRGPTDTDAFAPFVGRWHGTWTQDGITTPWRHRWDRPRRVGGLSLQRVRLRGPDGVVPAVNAACLRSGALTGVVGVIHGSVGTAGARPHAGFFVRPGELVWLALEQEDEEGARYSLFHERVEDRRYLVSGWDLLWQRQPAALRVLGHKSGQYQRQPR